jgi:hypothetical protein
LACNFTKLGDLKKAKDYIDSTSNEKSRHYILANYFEVTGDEKKALDIYKKIRNDRSIFHHIYHDWAIERISALEKINPVFLRELYYPTARPDFEDCIPCIVDSRRRTKIFDTIFSLQEVKECKNCNVVSIYKDLDDTQSSFYWVQVGHGNEPNFISKLNFYVDTLNFEIKFLDTLTKKAFPLLQWRNQKKK